MTQNDMSDEKLLVLIKKSHKYKNVKLLKWKSEKVAKRVITYKDETLFELGEDGYLLYIILYITLKLYCIILCYIILYYIIYIITVYE